MILSVALIHSNSKVSGSIFVLFTLESTKTNDNKYMEWSQCIR